MSLPLSGLLTAVDAQPQSATVSMHTSVLFVIDKRGRERALLDQAFAATELIENLRILLREPAWPGEKLLWYTGIDTR